MSSLPKQQLLLLYRSNVEKIRNNARNLNLSEEEVNKIFSDCFIHLRKNGNKSKGFTDKFMRVLSFLVKTSFVLMLLFIFLYVVLNIHQATSSIVLRNIQSFIYPGLKLLRFMTVPFVRKFPWLTSFYDESCLLQNPFFYINDMECWPCENVHSVLDITGVENKSIIESGIPYLILTNQKDVTFFDLKNLYESNKELFISDANNIKTSNSSIKNLSDVFESNKTIIESYIHINWRINRMLPARLIRRLFPRPKIINKWSGQSIERFVFIDGPQSPSFLLPSPECSYVFLIQGSGKRTIILKPTNECSKSCKTVSVVLKPSHVLWYNWWYWRPLSLPVKNSSDVSITYMNSYC